MRTSRDPWSGGSGQQTILDQWLALVNVDDGQPLDLGIVDAATGVVETLLARRRGLRGMLRRLGNTAGDLRWPLTQVNDWIADLGNLVPRSRRTELLSFECIASLTEGWADRMVRGPSSSSCLDAVTGLATPAVLRLRLREVYQQCRAYGITPSEAYCLVVVDANTDDLAPFERDAVMITTAGVIGDVFHSGETVVRHRSRIIVLAGKSESTRHRAAELARALLEAPITRSANPFVWDDDLPASTIDLDRQLRELVD